MLRVKAELSLAPYGSLLPEAFGFRGMDRFETSLPPSANWLKDAGSCPSYRVVGQFMDCLKRRCVIYACEYFSGARPNCFSKTELVVLNLCTLAAFRIGNVSFRKSRVVSATLSDNLQYLAVSCVTSPRMADPRKAAMNVGIAIFDITRPGCSPCLIPCSSPSNVYFLPQARHPPDEARERAADRRAGDKRLHRSAYPPERSSDRSDVVRTASDAEHCSRDAGGEALGDSTLRRQAALRAAGHTSLSGGPAVVRDRNSENDSRGEAGGSGGSKGERSDSEDSLPRDCSGASFFDLTSDRRCGRPRGEDTGEYVRAYGMPDTAASAQGPRSAFGGEAREGGEEPQGGEALKRQSVILPALDVRRLPLHFEAYRALQLEVEWEAGRGKPCGPGREESAADVEQQESQKDARTGASGQFSTHLSPGSPSRHARASAVGGKGRRTASSSADADEQKIPAPEGPSRQRRGVFHTPASKPPQAGLHENLPYVLLTIEPSERILVSVVSTKCFSRGFRKTQVYRVLCKHHANQIFPKGQLVYVHYDFGYLVTVECFTGFVSTGDLYSQATIPAAMGPRQTGKQDLRLRLQDYRDTGARLPRDEVLLFIRLYSYFPRAGQPSQGFSDFRLIYSFPLRFARCARFLAFSGRGTMDKSVVSFELLRISAVQPVLVITHLLDKLTRITVVDFIRAEAFTLALPNSPLATLPYLRPRRHRKHSAGFQQDPQELFKSYILSERKTVTCFPIPGALLFRIPGCGRKTQTVIVSMPLYTRPRIVYSGLEATLSYQPGMLHTFFQTVADVSKRSLYQRKISRDTLSMNHALLNYFFGALNIYVDSISRGNPSLRQRFINLLIDFSIELAELGMRGEPAIVSVFGYPGFGLLGDYYSVGVLNRLSDVSFSVSDEEQQSSDANASELVADSDAPQEFCAEALPTRAAVRASRGVLPGLSWEYGVMDWFLANHGLAPPAHAGFAVCFGPADLAGAERHPPRSRVFSRRDLQDDKVRYASAQPNARSDDLRGDGEDLIPGIVKLLDCFRESDYFSSKFFNVMDRGGLQEDAASEGMTGGSDETSRWMSTWNSSLDGKDAPGWLAQEYKVYSLEQSSDADRAAETVKVRLADLWSKLGKKAASDASPAASRGSAPGVSKSADSQSGRPQKPSRSPEVAPVAVARHPRADPSSSPKTRAVWDGQGTSRKGDTEPLLSLGGSAPSDGAAEGDGLGQCSPLKALHSVLQKAKRSHPTSSGRNQESDRQAEASCGEPRDDELSGASSESSAAAALGDIAVQLDSPASISAPRRLGAEKSRRRKNRGHGKAAVREGDHSTHSSASAASERAPASGAEGVGSALGPLSQPEVPGVLRTPKARVKGRNTYLLLDTEGTAPPAVPAKGKGSLRSNQRMSLWSSPKGGQKPSRRASMRQRAHREGGGVDYQGVDYFGMEIQDENDDWGSGSSSYPRGRASGSNSSSVGGSPGGQCIDYLVPQAYPSDNVEALLSEGASTSLQRHVMDEEDLAKEQARWARYAELLRQVPYPPHFNTQAAFNTLAPFSSPRRYLLLTPDAGDVSLGYSSPEAAEPRGDAGQPAPSFSYLGEGVFPSFDRPDSQFVVPKAILVFDHFLQRVVWLELSLFPLLRQEFPETPLAYYLAETNNWSQLEETHRRCTLAASRFLLMSFSGFSSVGMEFPWGDSVQSRVSAAAFSAVASFYIQSRELDTAVAFHLLGLGAMQAVHGSRRPQDPGGIWQTLLIWLMVRCVGGFPDVCGLPLLYRRVGLQGRARPVPLYDDCLSAAPARSLSPGAQEGAQGARRAGRAEHWAERGAERGAGPRAEIPGGPQAELAGPYSRHPATRQEREKHTSTQAALQGAPVFTEQKMECGKYSVLGYRLASCGRRGHQDCWLSLSLQRPSWLSQYRERAAEYMRSLEDAWCFPCAPPSEILTAWRQLPTFQFCRERPECRPAGHTRKSPSHSPLPTAARAEGAPLKSGRRQPPASQNQEVPGRHERREKAPRHRGPDDGALSGHEAESLNQQASFFFSALPGASSGASLGAPLGVQRGGQSAVPLSRSSFSVPPVAAGQGGKGHGSQRGEPSFSLDGHLSSMLSQYQRTVLSNIFTLGEDDGAVTSFVTEMFSPAMLTAHPQNKVVLELFRALTEYAITVPHREKDQEEMRSDTSEEVSGDPGRNDAQPAGKRWPRLRRNQAKAARFSRRRSRLQDDGSEPHDGEDESPSASARPSYSGLDASGDFPQIRGSMVQRAAPFQAFRSPVDEVSLLPAPAEDMIVDPLDVRQTDARRLALLQSLQRSDLWAIIYHNVRSFIQLVSSQLPDAMATVPAQDALDSVISAFALAVYNCGEALAVRIARDGNIEMIFPLLEAFEAFRFPLPPSATRTLRQAVRAITRAPGNEETLARLRDACGYFF